MRFASLLRGINVSGQKKIKMTDLVALYESIGFKNVESYIQSGNVAFDSGSKNDLVEKIEKAIKKHYNFDVPIMIIEKVDLQKTVIGNPFLANTGVDPGKLHVTFLENKPNNKNLESFNPPSSGRDEYAIKGKMVYLNCPDGYGKTKLTNTYLEKKLAVRATTRNWKTVNKLLQMMS